MPVITVDMSHLAHGADGFSAFKGPSEADRGQQVVDTRGPSGKVTTLVLSADEAFGANGNFVLQIGYAEDLSKQYWDPGSKHCHAPAASVTLPNGSILTCHQWACNQEYTGAPGVFNGRQRQTGEEPNGRTVRTERSCSITGAPRKEKRPPVERKAKPVKKDCTCS